MSKRLAWFGRRVFDIHRRSPHVAHPARPQRREHRRGGDVLLDPVRHPARQAPSGLRQLRGREPRPQARAVREPGPVRHAQPPRGRARVDGRDRRAGRAAGGGRAQPGRRGRRRLLLRAPGQALGHRSGRAAVGELRRARRRGRGPRGQDARGRRRPRPRAPAAVPADLGRRLLAELVGHGGAGHGGRRVGDRGAAALAAGRRSAAAGELAGHRARPRGARPGARSGVRCAPQPGGLGGGLRPRPRPRAPGLPSATVACVHRRPGGRAGCSVRSWPT